MPGVGDSKILTIVSGQNQSAPHDGPLSLPLIVKVTNDQRKAQANLKIEWTISSGEGILGTTSSVSDQLGVAQNTFFLGKPGSVVITAKIENSLNPVSFFVQSIATTINGVWSFNTPTDYIFDTDKIEINSGVVALKAADQTDDDFTADGFMNILQTGIAWDGTNNLIRLAQNSSPSNINGELDASWTPQWNNIFLYYKFNGTVGALAAGTTVSATIGANATTVGTTMQYVPGKMNQGVSFSSGSDQINGACDPTAVTNSFTYSAWVKATQTHEIDAESTGSASGTTGQKFVFDAINSGVATASGTGVSVGTNGITVYEHAPGYMPSIAVYNGNVGTDWAHIAVVYNNRRPYIYLNGILVRTGLTSPKATVRPNCKIGKGAYGLFPGTIDDAVIWNVALTESEIRTIFEKQVTRYQGNFVSRIMDGLTAPSSWDSLISSTTLPFLKELPNAVSETTTSYPSLANNTLMNEIKGLWHLNEVAGTSSALSVLDASGNNNHGTPTSATFGEAGRLKESMRLDTSGHVMIPNSTSLNITSNTMSGSAWIKLRGYPASGDAIVFAKSFGYYLAITANGRMGIYLYGTTLGGWHYSTAIVPLNTWTHVAYSYNGTTSTLYLNGKDIASTGATGNLAATTADLGIGAVGEPAGAVEAGRRFNGFIDEVAIWNRSLSSAEMLQIYRRGANRISFQVRGCDQLDCSDDASGINWKGPDGSINTYFSELTVRTFTPITKQFFQYRSFLESDDNSTSCNYGSGATWCSPELKAVVAGLDHYYPSSKIISKNGFAFYSLTSLTPTLGSSCPEGIGYSLSLDKTNWYWWDGSEWTISDGTVDESNELADLSDKLKFFGDQAGRGTVFVMAHLKSTGTSKCELDALGFEALN